MSEDKGLPNKNYTFLIRNKIKKYIDEIFKNFKYRF